MTPRTWNSLPSERTVSVSSSSPCVAARPDERMARTTERKRGVMDQTGIAPRWRTQSVSRTTEHGVVRQTEQGEGGSDRSRSRADLNGSAASVGTGIGVRRTERSEVNDQTGIGSRWLTQRVSRATVSTAWAARLSKGERGSDRRVVPALTRTGQPRQAERPGSLSLADATRQPARLSTAWAARLSVSEGWWTRFFRDESH